MYFSEPASKLLSLGAALEKLTRDGRFRHGARLSALEIPRESVSLDPVATLKNLRAASQRGRQAGPA
jgi:hypothetical protein